MIHNVPSSTSLPPVEIPTESQAYVVFEQWMDEELDRLVARWIHTASPNALRRDLVRTKFGR